MKIAGEIHLVECYCAIVDVVGSNPITRSRKKMDNYLQSIIGNYIKKWYPILLSYDECSYLEYLLQDTLHAPILTHWFTNCRAFHKSPCEYCEYRFRCYTN